MDSRGWVETRQNGFMKKLLLKLLGPLFAAVGVFGLAGSGIVWNFQGRSLGLPSTVISILVLMLGVVLLRPLARAAVGRPLPDPSPTPSESVEAETEPTALDANPALTTAESIAQELAESQKSVELSPPVNFAPEMLLPGKGLPERRRRPGAALKRYKTMASELFVSK